MEDKRMTEKESLELISRMIQQTKDRVRIGDGNMLLVWGYTTVGVALAVLTTLWLTHNPLGNVLWLLIPAIGIPTQKCMERKKPKQPMVTTYVDRISAGVWQVVGTTAFIGMATCLAFTLGGYGAKCWIAMLLYAFIIVGFGTVTQGIIIRERSLIFGGMFSIISGGIVTCCALCDIPLYIAWVQPLYIVCFALMMIVPGHIINHKARRLCSEN